DNRGIEERGVGIELFADSVNDDERRTLEIQDLSSEATRIENRIALRHRNIEYLLRAGGVCQDHIMIDDVAPVPDKAQNIHTIKNGSFLGADDVTVLARAETVCARRRAFSITVTDGHIPEIDRACHPEVTGRIKLTGDRPKFVWIDCRVQNDEWAGH